MVEGGEWSGYDIKSNRVEPWLDGPMGYWDKRRGGVVLCCLVGMCGWCERLVRWDKGGGTEALRSFGGGMGMERKRGVLGKMR